MADIHTVRKALEQVMDPELGRNIVELGMVHDLQVQGSKVTFTLALTTMACPLKGQMQEEARKQLLAVEGVREVDIRLRGMTDEEKAKTFGQSGQEQGSAAAFNKIRHVVAVMSGKGGVGKSSVSALLAVALRRKGHAVGVLDADITGPSIPKMLLSEPGRPMGSPLGILPVESPSGIKIISINLLLADPNQAVIWRGPLISGAIRQFWGDVFWGDLDYLIVDLPPGTSDASLTVMQVLPLNGIVLVTTPQSLAGMVVRKASSMADQLEIPIIGLVENMSYYKCPDCEHVAELFGPSHGEELAQSLGVPLLGRLPIQPEIAELADRGELESYQDTALDELVERLLAVVPEEAHTPAVK